MRVGICLKYLKREWNRKKGGETMILKGGTGSKGGCLKMEEGCNPLTNYYAFSFHTVFQVI